MEDFKQITNGIVKYNLMHLRQLVFEVTDACNLRCRYCSYADLYEGYDERNSSNFSFHRAKLIIDYLYAFWGKAVSEEYKRPVRIGFYGGEPTLNMALICDIVNYVESLPSIGRSFLYNMTTNAMLLDRYMDFFVQNKFNLLISLDGDEQGQSYRVDHQGRNSFERVIKNIKLLRDTYPDYFERHVAFNTVVHNKNGVANPSHFIKENFGKLPILSSLSASGVRKDKQEVFYSLYRNISDDIKKNSDCETLENELFMENPSTYSIWYYLYKYSGNYYNNYSQLMFDVDKVKLSPTGTCSPFLKKMFVTVQGKILQCEKIGHQFALGTVDDEKVNLDLEEVTTRHNLQIFKFIKQCETCGMNRTCSVCIYEFQEHIGNKDYCNRYVKKTEFEAQCVRSLQYLDKHPELYNKILTEVTSNQ